MREAAYRSTAFQLCKPGCDLVQWRSEESRGDSSVVCFPQPARRPCCKEQRSEALVEWLGKMSLA